MAGYEWVCSRCDYRIAAITEGAAREAAVKHWRAEHKPRRAAPAPVSDAERWPWRGRANRSQTALLRMAAAGEIRGYLTRVHDLNSPVAQATVDLDALMVSPHSTPWSSWRWYPSGVDGRLQRFVPGLLAAGLLLPPKMPNDPDRERDGVYRITPPGRAALTAARGAE